MSRPTRPTVPDRPRASALRGALAATALLAGAALLAGCSGEAQEAGAAPASSAAAPAAPAAAPSPAPPAETGAATPGGTPSTTVVTSMTTFTSPTGNISCYLAPVQGSTPYARCDLGETSWSVPEPKGGCEGRWGGGEDGFGSVGVGGGEAQHLCVGDAVADGGAPPLEYGSSIVMEPLTCTSTRDGMVCTNSATGHGFTAARAAAVLG
ncbi:DUF6636 domain-containing protein [Quadrisphaera sp. KR29]|uniref:DUF6636 domain-containing protein n=1 Tax=Quadrisphaera sp. KR29 TaxID=3461391 RepID=UPI004044B963